VDGDNDIFSPMDFRADHRHTVQGFPVGEEALSDDFFGLENNNCAMGVDERGTSVTTTRDNLEKLLKKHSDPNDLTCTTIPTLTSPRTFVINNNSLPTINAAEQRPSSLEFQTTLYDNASSGVGGNAVNHKEGTLAKQVLLARMYQNRSARKNIRAGEWTMSATEDHCATQSPVGSKRVFQQDSENAETTTASFLNERSQSSSFTSGLVSHQNLSMSADSLLHNSCKLYPNSLEIVRSALQFDPGAIRRAVLVESTQEETSCTEQLSKKQKVSNGFSYPVNIAIRHKGSPDVIEMLAQAAPDVLVMHDGPYQGSSIATAIRSVCDVSIIKALLDANRDQTRVVDRLHDLPLHTALCVPTVSLEVVKLILNAFPDALIKTNIRGETPVQVAERNQHCKEDIVNYLQDHAYSPFEASAVHMDDVELATVEGDP